LGNILATTPKAGERRGVHMSSRVQHDDNGSSHPYFLERNILARLVVRMEAHDN